MRKAHTVNPLVMKDYNVLLVQKCIFERGPISRIDIAAEINASAATVSRAVEELMKKNMVQNVGIMESTGAGRKAELLDFNYRYGSVIGLYIRENNVDIVLSNLKGAPILQDHISTRRLSDKQSYVEAICRLIETALREGGTGKLLTISVACFGLVDVSSGQIARSIVRPQLQGLFLKQELEARFGVPVSMENDVNMAAIGEYSHCRGNNIHDLAYLEFGSGIGAGIILNGELYRGFGSGAGELAYCLLEETDLYEDCREKGSLGDSIRLDNVIRRVEQVVGETETEDSDNTDRTLLMKLLDRYHQDDMSAIRLVDRIVDKIAMAVCNYCCVLNPRLIVMGGDYVDAWGDFLLWRVQRAVEMAYPFLPDIRTSQCSRPPELVGAVETALKKAVELLHLDGETGEESTAGC